VFYVSRLVCVTYILMIQNVTVSMNHTVVFVSGGPLQFHLCNALLFTVFFEQINGGGGENSYRPTFI